MPRKGRGTGQPRDRYGRWTTTRGARMKKPRSYGKADAPAGGRYRLTPRAHRAARTSEAGRARRDSRYDATQKALNSIASRRKVRVRRSSR